MYGLWWIVIGLAILGIIFYTIWIICRRNAGWFDDGGFGIGVFSSLWVPILLIFLMISITAPISANQEYKTFINQKEYVVDVYESGENYDNIAISQTIIELNTWLAEAKASKETWGCFSSYLYLDLNILTPIVLNSTE